jgi:predicted glutamine amidotransferase
VCGIFGFGFTRGINKLKQEELKQLAELSEQRGRDTSGFIFVQEKVRIIKSYENVTRLIRKKAYIDEWKKIDQLKPFLIFGHARLVTNGAIYNENYNHPIITKNLIGVHNGILEEVEEDRPALEVYENWESESDSYRFFEALDAKYVETNNLQLSFFETLDKFRGHLSVVFLDVSCDGALYLYTNTGSLACVNNGQQLAFGSETTFLKPFSDMKYGFSDEDISVLDRDVLYRYDYSTGELDALGKENLGDSLHLHRRKLAISTISRRELKRCKNCILPDTYPQISFDKNGICNYCNDYKPYSPLGESALIETLDKNRKSDGSPDCILGLSGGRDSCYGLHLLVKKYGMTPIAYTYDWGLTTDTSRINQSKLCSALGVEHIIRAADIEKKRRNIKINIEAWLERPRLGMVPLFWAGDKEFVEYGRVLQKERDIDLVIFCAGNPYETRDFFQGYCGVKTSIYHISRMSDYPLTVKTMLASYYIKEYLMNPRYLNHSFLDSIRSFLVSFIRKENFLYLFRYLRWDEEHIDQVLKKEYGWSSYKGYGKNQWRMGDGQTALSNYVFYNLGGFSEYDNFRSVQVREGVIDRDEAVALASEDNKPKYEAIDYLCSSVGINMNYLLRRIHTFVEDELDTGGWTP